jgi:hypothetical protein
MRLLREAARQARALRGLPSTPTPLDAALIEALLRPFSSSRPN